MRGGSAPNPCRGAARRPCRAEGAMHDAALNAAATGGSSSSGRRSAASGLRRSDSPRDARLRRGRDGRCRLRSSCSSRRTAKPASLARRLRCSSAPPRSLQSISCSSAMPARKPAVSPWSRRRPSTASRRPRSRRRPRRERLPRAPRGDRRLEHLPEVFGGAAQMRAGGASSARVLSVWGVTAALLAVALVSGRIAADLASEEPLGMLRRSRRAPCARHSPTR